MLKKVRSLVTAENVVNGFLNHQKFDHNKIDGYIESYQNGREQGLLIWNLANKQPSFYICEHRNSDKVCIYKGKYQMQSISEDAYKHQNFFDNYEEAINFLLGEFDMLDSN
jgi:hypothetical protein